MAVNGRKWPSKVARILDDPSNVRQLSADLKDNIKSRQSAASETPEKNFTKSLYTSLTIIQKAVNGRKWP